MYLIYKYLYIFIYIKLIYISNWIQYIKIYIYIYLYIKLNSSTPAPAPQICSSSWVYGLGGQRYHCLGGLCFKPRMTSLTSLMANQLSCPLKSCQSMPASLSSTFSSPCPVPPSPSLYSIHLHLYFWIHLSIHLSHSCKVNLHRLKI